LAAFVISPTLIRQSMRPACRHGPAGRA
jgi:hypothetical protein